VRAHVSLHITLSKKTFVSLTLGSFSLTQMPAQDPWHCFVFLLMLSSEFFWALSTAGQQLLRLVF
jgi:hypothetical protein